MSEQDERLLLKIFDAHLQSSLRDNASSAAVANAAASSGDMVKAIAAGLMTLGGRHAPLEHTFHFLSQPDPAGHVEEILKRNLPVPGWGGTFQKLLPDPLWNDADATLKEFRPDLAKKLEDVTQALAAHGRTIHPNPSAYTAALAIALDMRAETAVYLFIAARLDTWARIAAQYLG